MPCTTIEGDGFRGIACSRGRRMARCRADGCTKPGERLCDCPDEEGSGTCSRRICLGHTYVKEALGPEYCPPCWRALRGGFPHRHDRAATRRASPTERTRDHGTP